MKKQTGLVPSWYYVCDSAELKKGRIKCLKLGDRRWLGYRDPVGKAIVQDSRCPHMGTDLSSARLTGNKLQCPLHRWEFDSNGLCTSVPGLDKIPRFARLGSYPVEERHGKVFVFNQPTHEFKLPFFEGEDPDEFKCARVIRLQADCRWELVSANAFDLYHFEQFHGRRLLETPRITYPHPAASRIQHRFEIVQPSMVDRLLILAGGNLGLFDYTSWRGAFVLLRVQFQSIVNHLQIVFYPLVDDRCGIDIFVLERRGFKPKIPLFLKRAMTESFFRPETESLKHVHFNPLTLISHDEPLANYMRWLKQITSGDNRAPAADLPQSPVIPEL